MPTGMALRSREQQILFDLTSALNASVDLHAVLKDVYRLLLPLVGAEYGALAVTHSDRPEDFEWIAQDLPPDFLGSYGEMVPHDFVLASVSARLNTVLRDSEMIDRRSLERNMMYQRAREVGSPLEQVMAVMLHAGNGFLSGLSLYRSKKRPFTEREQMILQRLTPALGSTVRNCQLFAKVARKGAVLDALMASEDRAIIAAQPPAREMDRTPKASSLIDAWFPAEERRAGRLPKLLEEGLAEAQRAYAQGLVGPWTKTLKRDGVELEVEMFPVNDPGRVSFWAIVLDGATRAPRLPVGMERLLSPRERQVVAGLLQGWDEKLIAHELRCAVGTVKKHAQNVYIKLDVAGRNKLQSLGMWRR
ncbi:MAG: LuxR C-terminal-related transcriptional regulator [Polyangiaceae bacterium]